MSDIAQPHDRFLKTLLSDPNRSGTLLRERLPKEIAECLSDDPPQLVDGTFVDEELRSHLTDRLFAVKTIREKPAFLYVLIEHKSQPEKRIAWQLAKYLIEVLKQWERENLDWKLLPAVVPFVFYHGSSEWQIPNEFQALIETEVGWKPFLLNFQFPVFDLGHIDDRELSRHPRLKAWLMVAKYGTRDVAYAEIKGQLIKSMAEVPEDLPAFLRYMIETFDDVSSDDLREVIRGVKPEEEMEMMSQFAKEVVNQEKPGWIQMGRQEGRQEGEAALLLRQLQRRFGTLPEEIQNKVESADQIALETWGDRVLDAPSLEDVFKV
ncbi:MAG: Rpn family recombination-promoting nuclease/putative transposase [Magnetococcales bacterium]|nr:Rpn family recombination-promoting nuclease/putative transposase [Magnetococcales bacterium]